MAKWNRKSTDTLLTQGQVRSSDEHWGNSNNASTMRKESMSSRQCLLVLALVAIIVAISLGVGLGVTLWQSSKIATVEKEAIDSPSNRTLTAAPTSAPFNNTNSSTLQPLGSDIPSSAPSMSPFGLAGPTASLSLFPTRIPSIVVSNETSLAPTNSSNATSSLAPTNATSSPAPSMLLNVTASLVPTTSPMFVSTIGPTTSTATTTLRPTKRTASPTSSRPITLSPTLPPTKSPTTRPTRLPTDQDATRTIFYAIGDVPYTDEQADELIVQMQDLKGDAEFVIHVGDIRNGEEDEPCLEADYKKAADILRLSHAPVFIILGDNDWNDCINRDEALGFWNKHFLNFDSRHWKHSFNVQRQPNHAENFAFVHKSALFVGLNLVGGAVHSESEWSNRLTDQAMWTMHLIRQHRDAVAPSIGRVVIWGQADPRSSHDEFFQPLRSFIKGELQNSMPIMYMNGDKHYWQYEPNFYGQSSFLRIMVTGQTFDPPLKVVVNANGAPMTPQDAFPVDRGAYDPNHGKDSA